ncbi:SusC/RagA family TonB-linked outer membrane protein [Tenacibaculum geojense]|uniref:SusC/RagA family TonB-linked outer membrane protein n=1 Tax=Tenacibaculum geojense TaxID=915352 RepID=A0ABW3JPK5_9FLAO
MENLKSFICGILILTSLNLFAQQTVRGKVTEKSTGSPLPGVAVLIKGKTTGTETNFDGDFELKNVNSSDILVFSFVGMASKEIPVGNKTNFTVSLEEDQELLNEIVIVGYGTTTVKDATGSVEAITAKEFTKGNIVTADNLLSGRVSGVNVSASGAPGADPSIVIRGGSSLTASNNPLIVIDGLPVESRSVEGSRGILSNINPNDIESFSVLKDASATAIYGSRASNGVIIITTKKGRNEYSLDLDYQYTIGQVQDRIDVLSADQFRDIIAQRYPDRIGELGNANTNWQDEILRQTGTSQLNATVKGGVLGMPARLSIGFLDQEGSLITSNFNRKNVSVALNPSYLDDHLKFNVNYNRTFEDSRFADNGQLGAALRYDPTQSIYDASSPFAGFYQHRNGRTILNGTTNPVANLLLARNIGKVFRHYGNFNVDYKFHFLPELRAVVNVGFDETEGSRAYTSPFDIGNTNETLRFAGVQSNDYSNRYNELLDTYLNYVKEINDFDLDATVGYSYQRFTNDGGATGNIFNPNSFPTTYADPDVVNIGFFSRVNIGFLDKYLLTLNYRRDGTSRFSEENRWGDFGGAAFAWKISEEEFLKSSKTFSDLKLRVSYGFTGQQNLENDKDIYLNRYRFGNQNSQYVFNGQVVQATIPSPINPDIKWEETATFEVGLDYGLFNKFNGSISYFNKKSTDLLFNAPLSDGTNYSNRIVQNVGELEINGLEFTLNGDFIKTEDIDWNFSFNTTYLDRKINNLNGEALRTQDIEGGTGNTIQILQENETPNSYFVFKQLYDASGNPIENAYADLNGDGIVNDDDRYVKESPFADVTMGFQSNFNYKNFDFSFNLRASLGNYNYNNVNSSRAQYALLVDNAVLGNVPSSVLNTNFVNTADVIFSDIYLEDASFLRMDNITLGYTFDRPIKKFNKNSIRLWAGVQNVFVITNYSGLDPEISNGIDRNVYPRSRNFMLGANIKF